MARVSRWQSVLVLFEGGFSITQQSNSTGTITFSSHTHNTLPASLSKVLLAAVCFGSYASAAAIAPTAAQVPAISSSPDVLETRDAPAKNPILLLHGVGSNGNGYLVPLKMFLESKGYTVFSPTYGTFDPLRSVVDSSKEVAGLIRDVQAKTGAPKIDVIGHSGGAFLSLYSPAFEDGVADLLDRVVAMSPATHGTDFVGAYPLAYALGIRDKVGEILRKYGCPSCDDYGPGGAAVRAISEKTPVAQPQNRVTVIGTKFDTIVSPYTTSFVHEGNVTNIVLQDVCKLDTSGHIGETESPNTWGILLNILEDQPDRQHPCAPIGGTPF